jgi:hypothetical protein
MLGLSPPHSESGDLAPSNSREHPSINPLKQMRFLERRSRHRFGQRSAARGTLSKAKYLTSTPRRFMGSYRNRSAIDLVEGDG